jgi:hypothetical protein
MHRVGTKMGTVVDAKRSEDWVGFSKMDNSEFAFSADLQNHQNLEHPGFKYCLFVDAAQNPF